MKAASSSDTSILVSPLTTLTKEEGTVSPTTSPNEQVSISQLKVITSKNESESLSTNPPVACCSLLWMQGKEKGKNENANEFQYNEKGFKCI